MSLFWRIFLSNAAVLVGAAVVLLVGPPTVSAPVLVTEALILFAGIAGMLVVNGLLLRVGLAPLARLTRAMTTIDLLRPGSRLAVTDTADIADIAGLITTFNTMLDRLEAERAASAARALEAQEAERRRIAQELHDEIGQSLTAVLLELKRIAGHAPAPVREELHQVQEMARGSLDEIRHVARRLRPGVLEDLGLVAALKALAGEFAAAGLAVHHNIDSGISNLGRDVELVLYRVAQESLTNVARHAEARRVELQLRHCGDAVGLRIRDDGRGLGDALEGAGIRGMRERALLVGADFAVGSGPAGDTEVRLHVPIPRWSA